MTFKCLPAIAELLVPFVSTGLWSVALTTINIVSAQPGDEVVYEKCYLIDSRNECFFYPINWKTSWVWAQKFCSDNRGKLASVKSAKVCANT